jgi:hypothetical protein
MPRGKFKLVARLQVAFCLIVLGTVPTFANEVLLKCVYDTIAASDKDCNNYCDSRSAKLINIPASLQIQLPLLLLDLDRKMMSSGDDYETHFATTINFYSIKDMRINRNDLTVEGGTNSNYYPIKDLAQSLNIRIDASRSSLRGNCEIVKGTPKKI